MYLPRGETLSPFHISLSTFPVFGVRCALHGVSENYQNVLGSFLLTRLNMKVSISVDHFRVFTVCAKYTEYTKTYTKIRKEKPYICLTSVTRAKCGIRSTLCWKVGNISGPT